MGWKRSIALAAVSVIALVEGARAQTPQPSPQQTQTPTPAASEGVRRFDPAFFARFNPVTAYDMVRQLPGFAIDNGDSLRGFGATAGNVLIDGQRPASKLAISDELSRISARDIARIELIGAAAAGDIDVRGYTELANVVLKPATEVQISNTYAAATVYQTDARAGVRAGGTRSWKTKDLGVRLNAQITSFGQRENTDIAIRNAAGAITSTRDEFNQQNLGELLILGTVNWTPTPRDTLNVNARVMPRAFNLNVGSLSFSPAGALTQLVTDDYTEKDIIYLDLGGDWEHKFSPASAVKLIVINRAVSWRPQEFFEVFAPSGARLLATRNNSDMKTGEHVARGVWTIKPNDRHTVEFGAEGAFNYRDTDRNISNATGTGPFVPQFLPVASTRVEETRGEAFITDVWRVDPKLTLELGFTYEASRITQTGDANQEREFTYPKPRAVATWNPNGKDQFRFAYERTVAQLDFGEFASVIQLVQGQLTVGNPNLEPQQVWSANAQWKRPIGQRGSISVTGYYDQIDDVQDFIPLFLTTPACLAAPTSAGCVFTAAGNIGEGERWGGRIDTTLPLESVGIKGGILKITAGARDSKVTDPITGEERRITNELRYDWNIDFRQDIPAWKIAWGGDYSSAGDSEAFRLNEIQRRTSGEGDFDLFIETTRFKGMTVRLSADNLGDQPAYQNRRFFTPNRFPGGAFSSSELREFTYGPLYQLSVSGAF